MSETKTVLVEDILCEPFGFRVQWEYLEHWADLTVWEISGRERNNTALFIRKGGDSTDMIEDHAEAARYLVAYIKWDGCSEFRFGPDEPDSSFGHFHWCGPDQGYKQHIALLESLYKRSRELLPAAADEAPWVD